MKKDWPRTWSTACLVAGHAFAAPSVWAVLAGGPAVDRWLDARPLALGRTLLMPQHVLLAGLVGMICCWSVAACLCLVSGGLARAHLARRLSVWGLTVVIGATSTFGALFYGWVLARDLDALGPAGPDGCRVVVRTQPWMAAAHGDFLIQVAGEHRLRPTKVGWAYRNGGPSRTGGEAWTLIWEGRRAVITSIDHGDRVSTTAISEQVSCPR